MITAPPLTHFNGVKQEPSLAQLQGELGYSFADPTLLECCLTHVSHERSPSDGHNEVLESAAILKEAKANCRACARVW